MRRSGRGGGDRAGRLIEVEDGKGLGVDWTVVTSCGKILEQEVVWDAPLTHTELSLVSH